MKPLLSNKIISNEKITIVEDKEPAKVLNELFSNVLTNLNISQFNQIDQTFEKNSDPVNKAIVIYMSHRSYTAIKENCTSKSVLIKMLQSNKATKNTDIPTKLFKDAADILAKFVFISLNKCIE